MPSGPRIRANNVYGIISNNPLTAVATTYNSISLPLLPIVISSHAVVVLDPKRVYGDPEIVVVTTHTAASTVATIVRGQYGTSARSHPLGTAWAHVPVDEDWIEISTSITRPLDPYRGQMIYEYDTDKFVARSVTDIWQDVMPLGAWISWTPTLGNLSGGTLQSAKYSRHGRTIFYRFKYVLAGAGVGTNPSFTLPVSANAEYNGQDIPIGHAAFADNGTATYPGVVIAATTSTVQFQAFNAGGTYALGNAPTASVPFTWAINDYIYAWGTYEAVS